MRLDHRFAAIFLACALIAGPALAQKAASPQPKPADLLPGLTIGYGVGLFRDIGDLPRLRRHNGEPLKQLNHVGGAQDPVLTSKFSEGVFAEILGFIKLDKPGIWTFQVNSNDGVRVTLGGKEILEDPDVHGDRMSKPATVEVKEPGWYELKVNYFQRKGTWALALHWQPPGGAMEIVPEQAYARLKD